VSQFYQPSCIIELTILVDLLGGPDHLQIHDQLDQAVHLSPLPAYLRGQQAISAHRVLRHDLRAPVCRGKHCGNHPRMHTSSADLGQESPWHLHQPYGFLVLERSSKYHRRRCYLPTAYADDCGVADVFQSESGTQNDLFTRTLVSAPPFQKHRDCANKGCSVCVTSVLRMTTLRTGGQAQDQTFGTLNSTIWTTIEANTGIICACLPMLKTPLARLFPRYFPRKPEGSANGTLQSHGGTPPNTLAWDAHGMAYRMSPPVPVISKESRGTSNDVSNISNPSSPVGDGHIMPKAAMPKGVITKTTSVNVQYSEDQCCASSTKVSSPNNKDHSRSTSNLVGSEYNTVSSA